MYWPTNINEWNFLDNIVIHLHKTSHAIFYNQHFVLKSRITDIPFDSEWPFLFRNRSCFETKVLNQAECNIYIPLLFKKELDCACLIRKFYYIHKQLKREKRDILFVLFFTELLVLLLFLLFFQLLFFQKGITSIIPPTTF